MIGKLNHIAIAVPNLVEASSSIQRCAWSKSFRAYCNA